jgi:NAD(P)-dependent dehydrogenase (short-subunit alcohol dehydrogenase family)
MYGAANQSVYAATKAGVRSLTESLDAEWATAGIRVRSLMPGFIDTPLLQSPPNRKRNKLIRETVVAAGLEFTPVEEVADVAWRAVGSDKLHHVVGKTGRRMRFAARWAPAMLRRRARILAEASERVRT